jgi:hypothetical protein
MGCVLQYTFLLNDAVMMHARARTLVGDYTGVYAYMQVRRGRRSNLLLD